MATQNSIKTGYKVYKVQKVDEISWQSARKKMIKGQEDAQSFCPKMFDRNKNLAPFDFSALQGFFLDEPQIVFGARLKNFLTDVKEANIWCKYVKKKRKKEKN